MSEQVCFGWLRFASLVAYALLTLLSSFMTDVVSAVGS